MSEYITVRRIDDVPSDSRVCHYDELGERAKEAFPSLLEPGSSTVEIRIADGLRNYDCEIHELLRDCERITV